LEEELPLNPYIYDYEVSHNFPRIGEKVLVVNARRIVQKTYGEQLVLLALEDITAHPPGTTDNCQP